MKDRIFTGVGWTSFLVLLGQFALNLAPELYLPFCGGAL
jgi:hypothetical protein